MYRIFLDDGQGSEPAAALNAADPATGQNVDITIQDEDLPADKNAPAFFVGNNHQMLNPGDSTDSDVAKRTLPPTPPAAAVAAEPPMEAEAVGEISGNSEVETLEPLTEGAAAPAPSPVAKPEKPPAGQKTAEADKPAGFVPMPLAETAKEVLTTSGAGESPIQKSANEMELDVLPDLEEMAEIPAAVAEVGSPIIDDSDFPISGTEETGAPVKKTGGKQFEGRQDVETMAKAISTLLTQEKD